MLRKTNPVLEELLRKLNEQQSMPKKDETQEEARVRRLSELDKMKKAASLDPRGNKINDVDEESYLDMCSKLEGKLSCSAPPDWKEKYAKYMEERNALFGSFGTIKPVGKKRWT